LIPVQNEFSTEIISEIKKSISTKQDVIERNIPLLSEIAKVLHEAFSHGHKLLIFGNGGSAADSQHIAAEFVSKFNFDRQALPAIALTTDTSILTSISNDYDFSRVFARQIEAIGRPGDVALGISTSGNSLNVIEAMRTAAEKGLKTIGFTGLDGGHLQEDVEYCFRVPSNSTPRIQEVHITVAHALCGLLETRLCASYVGNGA